MFEREDWTLFRNLGTLGQKAGVPLRKLAALAVKELADNALDAGADVKVSQDGGWIFVEDDGPGIPGDSQAIARLFSIRRPLTSSKLVRVPSRGALGNGLRVVAGTVLASGGELYVETRGQRHTISPRDDGSADVVSTPCSREVGTLVAVRFGAVLPVRGDVLYWAQIASIFASVGKSYKGKTSPWWYDSEAFFEMCKAAGERSLEDLLRIFRDISAADITDLAQGRMANSLERSESDLLLAELRNRSKEPQPSVLGKMGDAIGEEYAYAHENGKIEVRGAGMAAQMPFSIDAFVTVLEDGEEDELLMLVNRTPITGEINVQRQKTHQLGLIGCGLKYIVEVGRKPVKVICNVTTPYMPVTTDGKEPDLHRYVNPLFRVIEKAAKKAKRKSTEVNGRRASQRGIIANNLYDAIDKASGNGTYRYSLRQLFYAVRPYMLEAFGKEPDYNYFAQVITDIEAADGCDLPGLYRDARGIIYHPHTRQEIPLGTLNVEQYARPEWTFNKILYSEKEGFFSILKDAGWPEQNDCALLTSKGFASRAARDVLDLIGETQEEIYFFCIHDADASGTLIYQALTEATRARGARKVHVINLGLDPWEALSMGLQIETFRTEKDSGKRAERRLPVASYVDKHWEDWLQTQRVELNAMSSPQFIEWLNSKFQEHASKVVPPTPVLRKQFEDQTRTAVSRMLADRILREAGFEGQVDELMQQAKTMVEHLDLESVVRDGLESAPKSRWNGPLDERARTVAQAIINE
jgi:hypothetical protein